MMAGRNRPTAGTQRPSRMNQHDVEQSADVRAFLPRPGEPVDTYAERLRTLHRDLSLVLQAVERGLHAEEREEPAEEDEAPVAPPPEPRISLPPPGIARVEVITADRRDEPQWLRDEPMAERRATAQPIPVLERTVAPDEGAPVERRRPAEDLPAPGSQPGIPARLTVPPWVTAAVLAGWLTIVALLLALLVDR